VVATGFTSLLGIRHPIMLAPMDIVAGGRLTKAVSDAGGFGVLGGGYGKDETWLRRELGVAGDVARIGVGFITWSVAQNIRSLDIVLERRPKALMLSFGDPAPHAERARSRGIAVICQVQTVAMAREAVAKGADIIVAQGAEGGGHGGSCATLPLVPAVVDAVGHQVPVVAAGGIADGRGLAAALALGAQGVAMGTRFYAADEALAHPAALQRIVEADGSETIRSILFDLARRNVWPAPFTGRALQNAFSRRWASRERELLQQPETEGTRYLAASAAGDFETAAVIAGEAVGLIHEVLPTAETVRRTIEEAQTVLQQLHPYHLSAA
jgi:nitronate monooxygenase